MPDSTPRSPDFAEDWKSGHIIVMTPEHNISHEGNMFEYDHYIAAFTSTDIAIVGVEAGAMATDWHAQYNIQASGNVLVQFYESPTASDLAACTSDTSHCLNRRLATAGHSWRYSDDKQTFGVGSATLLDQVFVAGGSGPFRSGGSEHGSEWILNSTKDYALKITNLAGGNVGLTVNIIYYPGYG